MTAFSEFLKKTGRPNHALYIYDGELILNRNWRRHQATPPEDNVVILHHQELAAPIESNFTTFA